MSHTRPVGPNFGHDSNMYDDQPEPDSYSRRKSPSHGHQNSRKDNSRTPPRGPAGDRMYRNAPSERTRHDERYAHALPRRHENSRSPRREAHGRYTDRDREGYQSPTQDHSRSRSRSPYFGGPPSRNVILEGLPMDMTQEDISNELQNNLRLEGLEEVRLIKDKRTGLSRQFAFAQFATIQDSRYFLERFYPNFSIYGAYDKSHLTDTLPAPTKVRIAYSREKDDRDRAGKSEDDWKCEVCYLTNYSHRTLCFRCNAPRTRATAHGVVVSQTNMSSFSGFATTGDSDASLDNTASQFLLLRGLEPGVNEDLLAKGVRKLYKSKSNTPPRDAPLTKKIKISSTSNDASLGAKDGSLRRVLLVRDRKSNESWRYGFAEFSTVEDAQGAMAKFKVAEKFTISSKPVLVSYIHAGVFVPVLHPFSAEFSKFTFSPLSNATVKLMYWDEAAYASEFVTAVANQPSAVKSKESEHAKLAAAAANEGLVGVGKEGGDLRVKKRKVDKDSLATTKKVVAPHLQFWTNRHAELHGIPPKDGEDVSAEPLPTIPKKDPDTAVDEVPSQTFADLGRKCCLLCSRQFKTEAEVNKHERMSQLHRDNMRSKDLVAKALAKFNKSAESAMESSTYRDRAKERRQAFNQPKQPAAQHNRAPKDASAGLSPNREAEDSKPVQSKGAALLGKMGWTAGEGLGAQGTGMRDAITTEIYTQGVGLGAQGGKIGDAVEEAERQTKGLYTDFLTKTKDKAKERFERLG